MMRSTFITFLTIVMVSVLTGCSGAGNALINQPSQDTLSPLTPAVNDRGGGFYGTHLCGFYEIHIDPVSMEVSAIPCRQAMFTLNAVTYLNGNVSNIGIHLNSIDVKPQWVDVDIDVTLKHPFLGLPEFNGYDVRGICMGDGSANMSYNPDLIYPVFGTDQYMFADPDDASGGPDGYTRWFNISEFSSGGMPILQYTQGISATPGFNGTATLNPYKYFADTLDAGDDLWDWLAAHPNQKGRFSSGAVNTRDYRLRFPNAKGIVFGYAVTANWGGAEPQNHPSNAPEAVSLKVTDSSTVYYIDPAHNGGSLKLDISVWDWDSKVSGSGVMEDYKISIESTVLSDVYQFNTSDMTPISGNANYSTYHVEIPADNVTGNFGNEYWVIIEEQDADYTNDFGVQNLANTDKVAACFRYDLAVGDTPEATGWARHWGSTYQDRGYSVVVDNDGNIYVCGNYYYTVDFDPGPGIVNHNSNGNRDSYISKFDPEGNFLWVRTWDDNASFGGSAMDIACDSDNNIYVTGHFFGTNVDFDPGPGVDLHSYHGGGGDPYLTVFKSNGDFLWARNWGSDEDKLASVGLGVSVDSAHNVYVCGDWWGSGDFDPGPGEVILSTAGEQWDAFITKFDASGNHKWARLIGSSGYDFAYGCKVDAYDEIFVTGRFIGSVDFDPGPGTDIHNSATEGNNFLWKLDANGNWLWARAFGNGYTFRLGINSSNNIYVRGAYWGTAQFDPDGGTKLLTATGNLDDFYNVFADNGKWLSVKTWGSVATGSTGPSYVGTAIWIDGSDNIYAAGCIAGTVDVDPGPAIVNRTSNGDIDGYVTKFDPSGNFLWCNSFGGTSVDETTMVAVDDATGAVYATGWFFGQCDFDPGPGEDIHIDHGVLDAFLVKYLPNGSW